MSVKKHIEAARRALGFAPEKTNNVTFVCPKCAGVVKVQFTAPGVWAISRDNSGCEACQLAAERLGRALENAWG